MILTKFFIAIIFMEFKDLPFEVCNNDSGGESLASGYEGVKLFIYV
jgi:hypothetical protein